MNLRSMCPVYTPKLTKLHIAYIYVSHVYCETHINLFHLILFFYLFLFYNFFFFYSMHAWLGHAMPAQKHAQTWKYSLISLVIA